MGTLKSTDNHFFDFPVDYVYRTVTDFMSYSKWWPNEINFDVEHLNPAVIGTTINVQNGPVKWKSRITAFRTNKLLAIDYIDGAWKGKTYWRFEERDGGTHLTMEIDLEVNRLWLKVLSLALNFSRYHSKQVRVIFSNLEKYLEKNKGSYIQKISLSHIDHVVLTVRDIEETCRFYHSILGVEVITFGEGRKALKFGSQKINLHELGGKYSPRAAAPTYGSTDICIISHTGIDQVIRELKQKNVEIIEGPSERTGANGKMISVYINDPDGNLIEISNPVH
jgi:catechol 2,3-dioxygenase-like lactoylglutathione lyase family enzyme